MFPLAALKFTHYLLYVVAIGNTVFLNYPANVSLNITAYG